MVFDGRSQRKLLGGMDLLNQRKVGEKLAKFKSQGLIHELLYSSRDLMKLVCAQHPSDSAIAGN